MPCIWYDDGRNYQPERWYGARVPNFDNEELIEIDLLHFARVTPVRYFSRMRHYILDDVILAKKNA